MNGFVTFVLLLSSLVALSYGHGMMLEPAGRSSRWRFDESAPVNYEDNELFCGGFGVQYQINGGKCGICGDDYRDEMPRPNEHGGTFGQGVIVRSYKPGTEIPVAVLLTTSHKGYFTFDLCNMDAEKETDECFAAHNLKSVDGEDKYIIHEFEKGFYNTTLQIPSGVKCKHCVLRWTYRTGNSWGTCEDGTEAMGCGDQEYFRSCADVAITA